MIAQEETGQKTLFGFWIYLMTDALFFGSLFAAFAVLRGNTFGGPSGKELFSLPFVLIETILLLTSSFTCGLALLHRTKRGILFWFILTFLLGTSFVGMEIWEFTSLAREGNTWATSGFLSSFFTLVGVHGAHVVIGLIWMLLLLIPVMRNGLSKQCYTRLTCLRLFWHFLDLIWIFIFTIVYLVGVL